MDERQFCDSIYCLNMTWLMIDNVMVDVCDSDQSFIAVRQDKISLNRMPMVLKVTQFDTKIFQMAVLIIAHDADMEYTS